ncbi:MAG: RNHCP domain-containing protein [Alphaproteobacteria bacterium]
MKTAKFTRTTEDFECAFCGTHVKGNGYTNHCPECLSSLHVDVNPGDRACACRGLMLAEGWEQKKGQEYIIQKCEKCGYTHKNKISPNDNREAIVAVANQTIDIYRQKLLRQRSR